MGLNRDVAARLAEERLAEWRRRSYDEWRSMLEDNELREGVGDDGKRYNLETYALNDGDDRVRLVVAVDDGGLSAFVPLTCDEIMKPDGSLVD